MKMIALSLSLSLFLTSLVPGARAAAPAPLPTDWTIGSRALLQNLAWQCGEVNWNSFISWARTSDFVQNPRLTFERPQISTAGRVEFPQTKITLTAQKGSVTAVIDGKSFSAADACALVTKVHQSGGTYGAVFSQLFPVAEAAGLVRESKVVNYLIAGAAVLVGVSCFASVGAGSVGLASGACVAAAAGIGLPAMRDFQIQEDFEKVMNAKFKIFCSRRYASLEFDDLRVSVDKSKTPFAVDLIELKNGTTRADNKKTAQETPRAREIAEAIVKNCNDQNDADQILQDFEDARNRAGQRFAKLSAQFPKTVGATAGSR